jgi:hypothetical protein
VEIRPEPAELKLGLESAPADSIAALLLEIQCGVRTSDDHERLTRGSGNGELCDDGLSGDLRNLIASLGEPEIAVGAGFDLLGPRPAARANSVNAPAVVIRPMLLVLFSMNHRFPYEPAAML